MERRLRRCKYAVVFGKGSRGRYSELKEAEVDIVLRRRLQKMA